MKTATLEQCKKFKELGIKFEIEEFETLTWGKDFCGEWYVGRWQEQDECISAPTSGEIAERLPNKIIRKPGDLHSLEIHKRYSDWAVIYWEEGKGLLKRIENKSFTQALADMLIWVKENGYLG